MTVKMSIMAASSSSPVLCSHRISLVLNGFFVARLPLLQHEPHVQHSRYRRIVLAGALAHLVESPAHEHRLDPAPRASIAGAHLRERDVALDRDRGRDRPHEQDGKHEEPACREELDDWIEDFHMRTS